MSAWRKNEAKVATCTCGEAILALDRTADWHHPSTGQARCALGSAARPMAGTVAALRPEANG